MTSQVRRRRDYEQIHVLNVIGKLFRRGLREPRGVFVLDHANPQGLFSRKSQYVHVAICATPTPITAEPTQLGSKEAEQQSDSRLVGPHHLQVRDIGIAMSLR
jgi:hypothetical protein